MLCVIALGGNIGDVPSAFHRAVRALSNAGFSIRRFSSLYTTAPVDCVPGTPDFVNGAVSGLWKGSPDELLSLCQKIEEENGRPKEHPYHTSRTLDLDLILFGREHICKSDLTIPHPQAANRDFVMTPLREIEPELADWLLSNSSVNTSLKAQSSGNGNRPPETLRGRMSPVRNEAITF